MGTAAPSCSAVASAQNISSDTGLIDIGQGLFPRLVFKSEYCVLYIMPVTPTITSTTPTHPSICSRPTHRPYPPMAHPHHTDPNRVLLFT